MASHDGAGPEPVKTKRRKWTDAELIWAAYSTVPAKDRRVTSYDELTEHAKTVWLAIAKRYIANGSDPPWPEESHDQSDKV